MKKKIMISLKDIIRLMYQRKMHVVSMWTFTLPESFEDRCVFANQGGRVGILSVDQWSCCRAFPDKVHGIWIQVLVPVKT